MYKVVYNCKHGGFELSQKSIQYLKDNGINYNTDYDYFCKIPRHNELLVKCIETLGKEANGDCSNLKIKEIYSKVYKIKDYDGKESVIELELDHEWVIIE
jgi:hypothetical protein